MRPFAIYVRPLLLLAGIGLLAFRFASDPITDRLLRQLAMLTRQHPYEKVYVQTDRNQYATGETVWLTAYLRDGETHAPDTLSRVLYVELVEPVRRRVVLRAALPVADGLATGYLPLPDTLAAGPYQCRAYTNFMRNAGEAFFFRKTLTIYCPDLPSPAVTEPKPAPPDVQFLPEGGQLINGLLNRVAVKAVGPDGRGLRLAGFVLDQQNDTIVGFVTQHLGTGMVDFTPSAGSQYRAFVRQPTGAPIPYPWPVAQPRGYGLTVDALSNPNAVRVFVTGNVPDSTSGQLTLLGQCRHAPVVMKQLPANRRSVTVIIPRSELPEGIVQLTLFDPAGQPLAERLIYSNRNNLLQIRAEPDKKSYKPREPVNLNLTVTDGAGQPVAAQLSVAVTDAGLLADTIQTDAPTLPAYLLLTSDLTGLIENPASYVDPTQPNRLRNLDLLLRTQGWRRFAWPQLLANTLPMPTFAVENKGFSLTGKVLRANTPKPTGKVNLTFMIIRRDSSRTILIGESDEAGQFAAYDLDMADTTNVLIQAVRNKNDRALTIGLDQLTTPAVTIVRVPYRPVQLDRQALTTFLKTVIDDRDIEAQIRRNRSVQLKEVVVKTKRTVERDTRKLYSMADATIKFDDQNTAGAQTLLDVIRSRVPGVQVFGSGYDATVQIRGAVNFRGIVEPLFVLDGIVTTKDAVLSVPVPTIEQVDVLKGASAAIYGSQGGGGVISVLTRRGAPTYDPRQEQVPGLLLARLPGLQPTREFYVPRYGPTPPTEAPARPDYRATLHWQTVRTGPDGKARLTFWTSDARNTRLRVMAEGITPNGQPGSSNSLLVVE